MTHPAFWLVVAVSVGFWLRGLSDAAWNRAVRAPSIERLNP